MTEQAKKTAANKQPATAPNLTHRLASSGKPLDTVTTYHLIDGIDQITTRAKAVLSMIQGLCSVDVDEEGMAAINSYNPELIYFALASVHADLDDIAAIGSALVKGGEA